MTGMKYAWLGVKDVQHPCLRFRFVAGAAQTNTYVIGMPERFLRGVRPLVPCQFSVIVLPMISVGLEIR